MSTRPRKGWRCPCCDASLSLKDEFVKNLDPEGRWHVKLHCPRPTCGALVTATKSGLRAVRPDGLELGVTLLTHTDDLASPLTHSPAGVLMAPAMMARDV